MIGDLLLFLDADTYFAPGGLDRIIACWLREQDRHFVLSLLPYHEMAAAYEKLSLVFNLLMAAGAGGFGAVAAPRLFGQSLLITSSAIIWISALWSTTLLLIAPRNYGRPAVAVIYLLLGLQLAWLARQLGSYRFSICLLYPLPLAYYCFIFARSAARHAIRRKTVWRGREV